MQKTDDLTYASAAAGPSSERLDRPDDLGAAFKAASLRFGRAHLLYCGAPALETPPAPGETVLSVGGYIGLALTQSDLLHAATRALADAAHLDADRHARRTATSIWVHQAHDMAAPPKPLRPQEKSRDRLLEEVQAAGSGLEQTMGRLAWARRCEPLQGAERYRRAWGQIVTMLSLEAMTLGYAHMALAACQPDPDLRQSQGVVREMLKARWKFDPHTKERRNYASLMDFCSAGAKAAAVQLLKAELDGTQGIGGGLETLERSANTARARLELCGVIADDPGAVRQTPVRERPSFGAPQFTFQRGPTLSLG